MTGQAPHRRHDWRHIVMTLWWSHLHGQDRVFEERLSQLTEAEQQQLATFVASLYERLTREGDHADQAQVVR